LDGLDFYRSLDGQVIARFITCQIVDHVVARGIAFMSGR